MLSLLPFPLLFTPFSLALAARHGIEIPVHVALRTGTHFNELATLAARFGDDGAFRVSKAAAQRLPPDLPLAHSGVLVAGEQWLIARRCRSQDSSLRHWDPVQIALHGFAREGVNVSGRTRR